MVKWSKFLFIAFMTLLFSCKIDFTKNDTLKKDIIGRVVNKYRDDFNHAEPTIVYENANGQFEYQVSDWAINSDFWEYIQINDSIKKPSGTLIMRVKKINGEYKDYQYQR